MLDHAKASDTDALVILRDGKIVLEEYFGRGAQPIIAMSASKSVASLAIGALKLHDPAFSLDERISATFPSWASDPRKASITIRQLMSHTSGLETARAKEGVPIETNLANASVLFDPGTDFRYNNAAVDFLSVLVFAKSKFRLDDILQRDVFGPIGVRGAHWMKDVAGNPYAAGELIIEPLELAKIGQLILQDGVWEGRRILPAGWVAESTSPSQRFKETCGLLWWLDAPLENRVTDELLSTWHAVGVSDAIIDKARTLIGQTFTDPDSNWKAVPTVLSKAEAAELETIQGKFRFEYTRTKLVGPVRAIRALGWLGQHLVILPKARLVAVRMHVRRDTDDVIETADRISYPTFARDVRALVGDTAL